MGDIITLPQLRFDERQIEIMRRTIGVGVPPDEFAFFLEVAASRGLNPFNREIYPVMRKGRLTIQSGIDGFRKLADDSGLYRGQEGPYFCGKDRVWVDAWLEDEPPLAARVGILREGFEGPTWAIARYKGYVQYDKDGNVTEVWRKIPDVMLAKCAEMLALRKTFPKRLAGIYGDAEMMQADSPASGTRRQISVQNLHSKGQAAGLWSDGSAFYDFCGKVIGRDITRDNARSMTSKERLLIDQAIDDKISATVVESKPADPVDESQPTPIAQEDGLLSVDDLSRELAEKQTA